ncbi:YhcN/YlaJ family sporulation lipoprotein [Paludifilum halophilum]|uniref:Sporulation protein n=1 Tax=Paludifilum halophilum TaxID=1642702 RepID=A0A235B5J5_9BACL|nr:YhcN/YlaJ family sporulation lipoprotein [Paludifilum halophilum]OYD07239.1 hypothetical protein CHM34_12715 [Paludifilum halophilum]
MKRVALCLAAFLLIATVSCNSMGRLDRPQDSYDESLYRKEQGAVREFLGNPRGHRRLQGKEYQPIGYSRQRQKGNQYYNATDGGGVPGPDVYIDREALARQIAHLTTQLPQVDDAAVVVTDDQVFVGVKGDKKEVSDKTVYEARRTALSLTPRYYQIHVTKDPKLRQKLTRIGDRVRGEGLNQRDREQLLQQLGDSHSPKFDQPFIDEERRRQESNDTGR